MRRGISIALVLLGIATLVTGIAESGSGTVEMPSHHLVFAGLFTVVACVHGWLNRKSLLHYFRGMGWSWAWVGLGIGLTVILLAIITQ